MGTGHHQRSGSLGLDVAEVGEHPQCWGRRPAREVSVPTRRRDIPCRIRIRIRRKSDQRTAPTAWIRPVAGSEQVVYGFGETRGGDRFENAGAHEAGEVSSAAKVTPSRGVVEPDAQLSVQELQQARSQLASEFRIES